MYHNTVLGASISPSLHHLINRAVLQTMYMGWEERTPHLLM